MYFAIVGRHPKLSCAEFAFVSTSSLRRQGEYLFFESDLEEDVLLSHLEKLGGIVKRGKVVKNEQGKTKNDEDEQQNMDIASFLEGVSIVGVNDQKLGMEIKKIYGVRRFKIVELTSSDLEIKKNGKELISLGGGQVGLVLGRQDIAHFEMIDFGKPASGMEIGMMPAKLTQILVNIGIEKVESGMVNGEGDQPISSPLTIYDPFCGFGTTGFVANRLGHHFVGSDIIIDGAKKNAKRRENEQGKTKNEKGALLGEGEMSNEKLHYTVFKHDVTMPFDHPVVKKVDAIVTEGWLGPVVSKKTREPELRLHAEKIIALYHAFLEHISSVVPHTPVVLTIPHYSRLPDAVFPDIVTQAVSCGYAVEDLGIYSRKGQEVCRQIVVLTRRPASDEN